jgi:predicted nucleotide-binding protein
MQKKKNYKVKFSPRVIRRAMAACRSLAKDSREDHPDLVVNIGNVQWKFDSLDEFFSDYSREDAYYAYFGIWWHCTGAQATFLAIQMEEGRTLVSVQWSTRPSIEEIFSIFDEAPEEDKSPLKSKDRPKVFIGHGRSNQWEKLKHHLQDKHKLEVVAYETGARAGHVIRDILDGMTKEASIALLVMTGEDKTADGIRARQNVIHECGLFQGRLGFDRAILIVERGVELASNLQGIQRLDFRKGPISEVFGDVIATIRREFGPI